MSDTFQALYLAGLGAFHGLNPAMGWLFAVALGLHRQNRGIVFASLLPIAVGHAVSIAAVAAVLLAGGYLLPQGLIKAGAALLLLSWAAYHWRFGHRHRVRFGMQTGLLGLAVWSFMMATAHGAGVMLWPALMPACLPDSASAAASGAPVATAVAGVGIHSLAMLTTTALVAAVVYDCAGLSILRRAWLNVDALWTLALATTAAFLLIY